MKDAADCLIVETTVGTPEDADRVATALVERRFAACVQAVPLTSTYRWEGAVRRDVEVLLRIKTVAARLPDVEATVLALHAYDLPELVVVPLAAGSVDYLDWMRRESADARMI